MTSRRVVAAFGIALLVSLSATSCHIGHTTGPVTDTAVFLDALSGPIRDKYPDAELISEGRKACDALNAGKSDDEVKAMIEKDLGVDPGQFIGAVYAGFDCA